MKLFLRPFLRSRAGTTSIEFAMVASVMLPLIIGIVEYSMIMMSRAILEGATNIGSRIGKTGFSQGDREIYVRNEIKRLSGGYLDPNLMNISVITYDNFDEVDNLRLCNGPADPGPCSRSGPGAGGQVVLYRVTYPWKIITPFMAKFIGDKDGTYMIEAVSAVRNEAFPGS